MQTVHVLLCLNLVLDALPQVQLVYYYYRWSNATRARRTKFDRWFWKWFYAAAVVGLALTVAVSRSVVRTSLFKANRDPSADII